MPGQRATNKIRHYVWLDADLWDDAGTVTAPQGLSRTEAIAVYFRWLTGDPDAVLPTPAVRATEAEAEGELGADAEDELEAEEPTHGLGWAIAKPRATYTPKDDEQARGNGYGPCPTCLVAAGSACRSMRLGNTGARPVLDSDRKILQGVHPGRKRLG